MKKKTCLCIAIIFILNILPYSFSSVKANGVQSIAAGKYHSAAIKDDGSLYMFGYNACGQLGTGDSENRTLPEKIMDNVRYVACGDLSTAVIDENGSLFMFGSNSEGMFGNDSLSDSLTPVKVLDNVRSVSVGATHTAVITTDGDCLVAGNNSYGQLGTGDVAPRTQFTKIMENCKEVVCGSYHTAVITNSGELYTFGRNTDGQLGNGNSNNAIPNPHPEIIAHDVKGVSCSDNSTFYIDNSGNAYGAGDNFLWKIKPIESIEFYSVPQRVCDMASQVEVSSLCSAVVTGTGKLLMSGYNLYGQFGVPSGSYYSSLAETMVNVSKVEFGAEHTLVVTNDGKLYAFGSNTYGQLGVDVEFAYAVGEFAEIECNADTAKIEHNTGIALYDNTLYTWGDGTLGQFADGRRSASYTPVRALDNIACASVGYGHGAAVTVDDDALWWGSHRYANGQYVQGPGVCHTPQVILEDSRYVSCGDAHTGIITNDDKLYIHGSNFYGQAGLGTGEERGTYYMTPAFVTDDVKDVICTNDTTVILKNSGELLFCGFDDAGFLGGGPVVYSKPVKISDDVENVYYGSGAFMIVQYKTGEYDVITPYSEIYNTQELEEALVNADSISVGRQHAAFITEGGDLYLWGYNYFYQLGTTQVINYENPVKMADNVREVHCGMGNTIYITNSGDVYAAGSNNFAQNGRPCDGIPVSVFDSGVKTEETVLSASDYEGQIFEITGLERIENIKGEGVSVSTVDSDSYNTYYYESLDVYAKSFYEQLDRALPAIKNGDASEIRLIGISNERAGKVDALISARYAYTMDHPEEFILDNRTVTVRLLFAGYRGECMRYVPTYSVGSDIAVIKSAEADFKKAYDDMISECTGKTAYETVSYVYNSFIDKTTPLAIGADSENISASPYAVLCYNDSAKPDSSAYAYAVKVVLDGLGFENIIVTGKTDSRYGYWNIVKMDDGQWYAIDAYRAALTGDRDSYFLRGESIMSDRSFENANCIKTIYPQLSQSDYRTGDYTMYMYEKEEIYSHEYFPRITPGFGSTVLENSHVYMLCAEENGQLYALSGESTWYYEDNEGLRSKRLDLQNMGNESASELWYVTSERDSISIQNAQTRKFLQGNGILGTSSNEALWSYDKETGELVSERGLSVRLWYASAENTAFVSMNEAFYRYSKMSFVDMGEIGDCNSDGKVNTGDAVQILKHSASMITFDDVQSVLADVDRDGAVNTGDAVAILRMCVSV